MELYNVLVQIRLTPSKTKRDTLIGLTFAGINFRELLQPQNSKHLSPRHFRRWGAYVPTQEKKKTNSKHFTMIYFRSWDFFKNFAIFADQILVMIFFQNGKMTG